MRAGVDHVASTDPLIPVTWRLVPGRGTFRHVTRAWMDPRGGDGPLRRRAQGCAGTAPELGVKRRKPPTPEGWRLLLFVRYVRC